MSMGHWILGMVSVVIGIFAGPALVVLGERVVAQRRDAEFWRRFELACGGRESAVRVLEAAELQKCAE